MAFQGLRLRLAVICLLVTAVLLTSTILHVVSVSPLQDTLPNGGDAVIAVEHDAPLALSVEIATKGTAALVAVTHDAPDAVPVSVPSDWKRGEVRGGSVSNVAGDEEPSLGFRRFTVPAGATVTFQAPEKPETLTLHNPSGISVLVKVTRVDLTTEEVSRDMVLVQKKSKRLW